MKALWAFILLGAGFALAIVSFILTLGGLLVGIQKVLDWRARRRILKGKPDPKADPHSYTSTINGIVDEIIPPTSFPEWQRKRRHSFNR